MIPWGKGPGGGEGEGWREGTVQRMEAWVAEEEGGRGRRADEGGL